MSTGIPSQEAVVGVAVIIPLAFRRTGCYLVHSEVVTSSQKTFLLVAATQNVKQVFAANTRRHDDPKQAEADGLEFEWLH